MSCAPLNILMVASEVRPFLSSGGLGDVVDALGRALAAAGHRVVVAMPFYSDLHLRGEKPEQDAARFEVEIVRGQRARATVHRLERAGLEMWFVDNDHYFAREGLYGDASGDYPDNARRFLFLARAALEAGAHLGFAPDIVHAHDWQGAWAATLLPEMRSRAHLAQAVSVLTVHNPAFQGMFEPAELAKLAVAGDPGDFEFWGRANALRAAIRRAGSVNTVSERFREESRSLDSQGFGLQHDLRARGDDYTGILNGIDTGFYDPGAPADLHAYKREAKLALLEEFDLAVAPESPVLVVVSRLTWQKGLDLVVEAAPGLLDAGAALVVAGSAYPGDDFGVAIERGFKRLAAERADRVSWIPFDPNAPKRMFAGGDILLMPSRFEPCGLAQQAAMRYGCLPAASHVGGLVDIVVDLGRDRERGSGFFVSCANPHGFLRRARRAIELWNDADLRRGAIERAAARDATWNVPRRAYEDLYLKVLKRR